MTNLDLIKKVAESTGMSQNEIKLVFDGVLAAIKETIIAGETITLQGLCTFSSQVTPPRVGRNPHTGIELQIPSKWTPKVKVSSVIKTQLAEKPLPKPTKKKK